MNRVEFAKSTAAAIRSAQSAKASVLEASKADAQKLASLAAEIERLELELDPENLSAIQELALRREQHARLTTKFAADGAARLADADKKLSDSMPPGELAALFQAEHAALLEMIADVLKPFIRSRLAVVAVAKGSDAAGELWRLCYIAQNNQFNTPLMTEELLTTLDSLADGKPPWFFET